VHLQLQTLPEVYTDIRVPQSKLIHNSTNYVLWNLTCTHAQKLYSIYTVYPHVYVHSQSCNCLSRY